MDDLSPLFGTETDLNGIHLRRAITGDKMALAYDVDNEAPSDVTG